MSCKVWKIPDLAGKIWNFPNLAGKIWNFPNVAIFSFAVRGNL